MKEETINEVIKILESDETIPIGFGLYLQKTTKDGQPYTTGNIKVSKNFF